MEQVVRIAFLAPARPVHTVKWVNEMARRGHDVHLITSHPAINPVDRAVHLHSLFFPPKLGYFLNVPQLRGLLKRIRPDVLHTHYASGYGTLGRLSAFHPEVLSVWGSDVYDFPRESSWKRRLLEANLAYADRLSSTSRAMAEETRKWVSPGMPIAVVPFGVDTDRFAPRQTQRGERPFTVGIVKTLKPKYGIDLLLRAFALFLQHVSSTASSSPVPRLMIAGGGPEESDLRALANELKISDAVSFVGIVPHSQVSDLLHQFDIFVAPSRLDSESFGVAVVEAAACELPVIVSDVDGLREVTLDGKTGMVVPRNDVAALTEAMVRLWRDPALCRNLGKNGREQVLKHYRWQANANLMEKLYVETTRGSVPTG